MSDFQTGLVETTSRLVLIISRAEEAYLNVQRFQSEALRIRQQVDVAWSELSEHRESFQSGLESAQAELAEESESTLQVILHCQEKVDLVREELTNSFQETYELAIALNSKINELRGELGTEYTNTENAVRLLANQHVGTDIDSTASSVTENLSEINDSIDGYQQSVEEKADALHEFITQQCLPEVDIRSTACTDHIEGMLTYFGDQLDSMKTAAREQIERIFQLVDGGQSIFQGGESLQIKGLSDLSGELTTLTSVVEGFMGRLAEALREGTAHVVTGIEKQAEIIDEATEDFKETTRQLQDIKDVIDRFND
jgi:hypothetical protein